ncbi:MAG: Uma2 family endonuclease [Leptolyngbyaceae bacterium]|nr:Uma2 family endonuclease [Leptolyngbyaceae bacterium]
MTRPMTLTQLQTWTVSQYHQMLQAGILSVDDPVELLEGQIIEMSPQQPPHAATTHRASSYLASLLADQAAVRVQLPITLLPNSEPEPDIAIVHPNPRDYVDCHPTPVNIFWLIEVADTTLAKDRTQKAPVYAKAGIPEYWILEVTRQQVYVFRQPGSNNYHSRNYFSPRGDGGRN